jgi:hypothetical protein
MTLSRIRASVEISRPVVAVESYGVGSVVEDCALGVQATLEQHGILGAVSAETPVPKVLFVIPFADIQWITVTYDAELDFRGLNKFPKEFQVVADAASVGFTKVRADSVGTADIHTLLLVKKNPNDPVHTADTRIVTYQKPLADAVDATDDLYGLADADDQQTMFIAKSLPVEYQQTADVQHGAFHKPFAEPQTTSDVQTASFAKARSDTTVTTEVRTVTFEKPLADSVDAGDELNGSFQTDDGETMFLVKPLYDGIVQTDLQNCEVGKEAVDTFTQSDYLWPFDMSKGIEDPAATGEIRTAFVEKPFSDQSVSSDDAPILIAKPYYDTVKGQREGPNSFSDYFAADYSLDEYVTTGIPAFDFIKARSDQAATAEYLTRGTTKPLGDAFVSLDELTRMVHLGKTDSVGSSEIRIYSVVKPIADTFGKSDSTAKLTEKALVDVFGKSDNQIRAFTKELADSSNTVDILGKYVNKYLADLVHPTDDFYGAANTDDDQTMSFVTGRSESVAMSEAASRGVGKQLTDSVGKSDSGSFRMTSYCDVNYFTSDFVGITSTF